MDNRISCLIKTHSKSVSEFSRVSGVPYGTLYDIVKGKTQMENIGIGNFLKIAACLNMTAEELYYGTPPDEPTFADPQQTALNGYYECMNETGRKLAVDSVKAMSAAPELRMVKEGEDAGHRAAMGA